MKRIGLGARGAIRRLSDSGLPKVARISLLRRMSNGLLGCTQWLLPADRRATPRLPAARWHAARLKQPTQFTWAPRRRSGASWNVESAFVADEMTACCICNTMPHIERRARRLQPVFVTGALP